MVYIESVLNLLSDHYASNYVDKYIILFVTVSNLCGLIKDINSPVMPRKKY